MVRHLHLTIVAGLILIALVRCASLPDSTPVPPATPTSANLLPTGVSAPRPSAASDSQCIEQTFYSAALQRLMPYYIYLPPGYADSGKRLPVLYLFSGVSGDHREWPLEYIQLCAQATPLIASAQIRPMMIVMPAGSFTPGSGIGSYWFNHAPATYACQDGTSHSDGLQWGDYLWRDLVDHIDATYRTLPRASSRAVGGLSAGGQGALTLALTHPERFSIAAAHSPSIRTADGSLCFFGNQEFYHQYDPDWLLRNTETWRQVSIWIDVGAQDVQWGPAINRFHEVLDTLGVAHEFRTYPGTHDDYYWAATAPEYLRWYSQKLAGE